MSFPQAYVPAVQYPKLSDEALIVVMADLTQDLINWRQDLAGLSVSHNSQFFQVFLDANGESVAARNRLAEAATAEVEQERIVVEANIASIVDLLATVRSILEWRRHGHQHQAGEPGQVYQVG